MIGDGRRAPAGVLLRRQPRRRLAAPLPRRDRARLAAADRDRGAQPRRAWRTATRRAPRDLPFAVLRGYAGTDLVAHTTRARSSNARSPASGSPRSPALRPDVAIVHAQEADRDGNVQLWGIPGVQKEAVLAARRSLVTVERIVERARAAPGRRRDPGLGDRRRRARAGRLAALLQPGHHRPRQRLLPRAGTRSAATATRFGAWMEEHVLGGGGARDERGDHRRGADDRRGAAAREHADGVHRRRAAEHGGDPRAHGPQPGARARSTSRARSAPSRSTSRSRSATASWPRPPTPSSRCRRCSTTGSAPAASRSRSSAPRRSTASPTSTRP